MATTPITINIDSTILPTVVEAICYYGGYYGLDPSTGLSEVTGANAKKALVGFIRQQVVSYLTAIFMPYSCFW
jgi:hypothetical protein